MVVSNFNNLNFDNWKCRCSAIGQIMSKSGKITQGVETYLKQEYNSIARGFYEEFTSKYTDKGHYSQEQTADVLQSFVFDNKLLIKSNDVRKSNDYLTGECDFDIPKFDLITDAKNSYSWKTFYDAILTSDYEYQLRGYMCLWERSNALLMYTLFNLPEHQLQDLERKLFYSKQMIKGWVTMENSDYELECEKLRENWNFEKFDINHRVKFFEVKRDLEIEQKIFETVQTCRTWLNEFHQNEIERTSKKLTFLGI